MADRPILFSAPMVQALLAGTKTQTRRKLRYQAVLGQSPERRRITPFNAPAYTEWQWRSKFGVFVGLVDIPNKVGDRLYVREAWRVSKRWDDTPPRDLPERKMSIILEAGGSIANEGDPLQRVPNDWPNGERPEWIGKFRQAMHMPRWASRIALIVKDVRVERIKDISRADALAEGIIQYGRFYGLPDTDWDDAELTAEGAYFRLWDRINGDGAADLNPFVVTYTFEVIKQNIDQIGRAA